MTALIWGSVRGAFFNSGPPNGATRKAPPHSSATNDSGRAHLQHIRVRWHLIWRGVPVFIDGRALREAVFLDYRKILGTPAGDPLRKEALARYGVNAIVVNSFEYNSGALYAIARRCRSPASPTGNSCMRTRRRSSSSATRARYASARQRRASSITSKPSAACTSNATRRSPSVPALWAISSCAPATGRARRALALYLEHPYAADPKRAAPTNNSCNSEVYLAVGSPMATGTLASVNEYLSTSYDPDCEYLDGVILERNVGERDQLYLQEPAFAWSIIAARNCALPSSRNNVCKSRRRGSACRISA